MDLHERIEKKRFFGREFLLWLWFESELLEATTQTKSGEIGLWIEKQLTLSVEKEKTAIRGTLPAKAREAKESLLLGKMPEAAGFHYVRGEREGYFVLKGETLALSAVSLPVVLVEDEEPIGLDAPPPPRAKKKRERSVEAELEQAEVMAQESFFERMHLLRELEEVVEELFSTFLVLRLDPQNRRFVTTAMEKWARGESVDADSYAQKRKAALAQTPKTKARK